MTTMPDGAGDVLRLVRSGAASTTSELAAQLGVARSTVGQRLDALAAAGLLDASDPAPGQRGRPATSWRFAADAGTVLGVQVGMTGSQVVLSDLEGREIGGEFVALDLTRSLATAVRRLGDAGARLARRADAGPLFGVGVGLPSAIEFAGHRRSLGIDGEAWTRDAVRSALADRFDVPVVLDLDVSLLAAAERARAWPDAEVLVCLKIGTVVNAAVVVDGRPIHGARGLAGEFGHARVASSTVPCSCGSIGCVDAVASGGALVRRLRADGLELEGVGDLVRRAQSGEPRAVGAIRDAGRMIGEALAPVVNLLNPDVVCGWGYLADAGPHLFTGIREGVLQGALPDATDGLPIVLASGGPAAGAVAAGEMVVAAVLAPDAVDTLVRSSSARSSAG